MGLTPWISIGTNCIFYWIAIYRILQHTLSFGGLWGGGGGEFGLILAGYVSLASHNSYPIIVFSVPRNRLLLSHF